MTNLGPSADGWLGSASGIIDDNQLVVRVESSRMKRRR